MILDWIIEETPSYRDSAYECGDPLVVANGIFPIRFGLKREPTAFLKTGICDKAGLEIWLAKTKLDLSGPEIIMSYTVRYAINYDLRIVLLLHVEVTPSEDMDWTDDDPPPF